MEKNLQKLHPLFQKFSEQQKEIQQTTDIIIDVLSNISSDPKECKLKDLPQHFTTQEVIDYLDIHSSNFYRNVHEILLFPVLEIGARKYYLQSDVKKLFISHETGAHTYSKMRKKGENDLPGQ